MRAIIQRVLSARYDGKEKNEEIGRGYLILLGVAQGDTQDSARILADKISLVRGYQTEQGEWDAHLRDIHGDVMIVPDPDILARCIRGRRPIYNAVADMDKTKELAEAFASHFTNLGLRAVCHTDGTLKEIETCLDGPVTFMIDTADL
jgi:D-tyrosyl-tRNA(Tyr) deacylase